MNFNENGKIYGDFKINSNTYVITNKYKNFIYLLIGNEKSMLIDTGYGEGSLREIVEEITDKPVIVVNTHGHFDHTGGNGEWEEVWISKESVPLADKSFDEEQEKWRLSKPYPNYKKQLLTDKMTFDLGGRLIEVITIGCHEKGSVALLDSNNKILFVGDEIEAGQVLLFSSADNMPYTELAKQHKANMEKLLNRADEFNYLCPSHNGLPLIADEYLSDYIKLSENIISGDFKAKEHAGGFGFPPIPQDNPRRYFRVEYGLASFICQDTAEE